MILIIISALISSAVMILLMPINIKKLNKIAIDKELNKISEKYPDNIEICKEILKKMENEKTQIEENAESDSTLYIALQDKIYLGNMHGSFTRIQTIAHECLHSIQDRKVLIFNFIFSNIYILYFIISSILIIIKKLPNELVFSNILLIISMLYYAIRMFLENDAMTKSEYLIPVNVYSEYSSDNFSSDSSIVFERFKLLNRYFVPPAFKLTYLS